MSYSTFGSQRSMAFDNFRNQLYAQAIRKLVTPETVVLDLGAGLGIHGLVAAAAGAKRVYLVEPEPIINIAMEIARANGLAEKIVILEGKIEDIELPEKVDLIVSVFTGNLLFSEDLLPSLFYARDRYLKPGGHLTPDLAELVLAPVSAPEYHAKNIGCWSQPNMGLDFSSGRRFAANEILWPRREEAKTELLAPGITMTALDLNTVTHANCEASAHCRIETAGLCHGLMGWIKVKLGDNWLGTGPADPEVHWTPAFLPVDPPVPLEKGEDVELRLQRPAYGDWTWTIKAASSAGRHSSFLGRVDGLRRLRKIAPDNCPGLGQKGEHALRILEWMQQGFSNQKIAQLLVDASVGTRLAYDDALRQVQVIAIRYAK